MGRFINPFTDVGFKRIFRQEFSKPPLLDFLNNLLKGEREITGITARIFHSLPEFQSRRYWRQVPHRCSPCRHEDK